MNQLLPPSTATPGTAATATLRVWSQREAATALALWQEIETRHPAPPLATSAAWTRTWLKHYGEIVRYQFLVLEAEGRPRGIVLVTESTESKAPFVTLATRHLGTAGDPVHEGVVVEYNSLLVEPAWRLPFVAAVTEWLQTTAGGDVLCLDGFTQEEAAELTSRWTGVERRDRESKYLDLTAIRAGGGDVISALGRSTRANLRRKLREYGDLQVEWAESLPQAQDILDELIVLHQARWTAVGKPGAFASARFTAFQRSLLAELLPTGRSVVFRVRHQGATVGCLLLLNDRGRLLDYLSGLADFEQKPSPGLISHYLCQCEALTRGFVAYDFLVGDKRHKDNLSTHSQILAWTQCARPSIKNQFVQALTQVKRRWLPSTATFLREDGVASDSRPATAPSSPEQE